MQHHPFRVLTVAALAAVIPASALAAGAPAASSAGAPRVIAARTPVYTSALWLPLRRPAKVSCVKTNCRPHGETNHGHWAIDFLGARRDPVFATGYGFAHIGARFNGCSRGKAKRGNWVWVDHGAGEISAYTHLDSIAIREGQRVTPATMLGRMGRTGTCGPNYLHYERRLGGLHGRYLYPESGRACLRARAHNFPGVLGYGNWNGLPIKPRRATVWSEGVGCTVAPRAIARPGAVTVLKRWQRAVKLTWAPVPGADRYAIAASKLRRASGLWRPNSYRYTKRTTMIVRGLRAHGHYRFSIAASRAGANSPWSPPREAELLR